MSPTPGHSTHFQISNRVWRHFFLIVSLNLLLFCFTNISLPDKGAGQMGAMKCMYPFWLHGWALPPKGGDLRQSESQDCHTEWTVIEGTCKHWWRTMHPCPFGFWTPTPAPSPCSQTSLATCHTEQWPSIQSSGSQKYLLVCLKTDGTTLSLNFSFNLKQNSYCPNVMFIKFWQAEVGLELFNLLFS